MISPLLANVYLHVVLDRWFAEVVTAHCRGKVVTYAAGPLSYSVPLVLGTPAVRGSSSTAILSARAVALKTASLM